MMAYCFASGHIEFGHFLPDHGALPIAKGRDRDVRRFLCGVAEHSRYQKDMLLVPGFRADRYGQPDQDANLGALGRFLEWISRKPPKGIKVFASAAHKSRLTEAA